MDFQDCKQVSSSTDFPIKPEMGENKIRIISTPEPIGEHFDKVLNRTITCVGGDKGCVYCNAEQKPSVKYILWAYVYSLEHFKMLKVGWTVIKEIKILSQSTDWGFPKGEAPPYDIIINRSGEGKNTEYKVNPSPNQEPLPIKTPTDLKPIADIIQSYKDKVLANQVASELGGTVTDETPTPDFV